MEDKKVKLLGISIKKLYGCYNYNVNFNSDVTFLFGTNGCGKTTILNITEAIITGQLLKLFNYKFNTIKLYYAKNADIHQKQEIKIMSYKNDLKIYFNNEIYEIDSSLFEHRYFNVNYDFLDKIKNTFNYVYLPLNRSYIPYHETFNQFNKQKNWLSNEKDIDENSHDGAMIKIEKIINLNHTRASLAINKINDSFRNSILKPQIEINDSFSFTDLLNNNVPDIEKIQSEYIKILKDLNIINKNEEKTYNDFFNNYMKEFALYLSNKKNNETISPISLNLLFKLQEIYRIQKTIAIAEKMEQRKAAVRKPIETFLATMNNFIGHSEDGKELCINNDGQIYFKTKFSKEQISIQHLSSGEKQLITFFTNLIFMVKDKSSGIFVVDEPELSLHLSWQKIFIDKVLEINNNIQLIFATHAPEIVGRRKDKMIKLEKYYVKAD